MDIDTVYDNSLRENYANALLKTSNFPYNHLRDSIQRLLNKSL